MEQPVDYIMFRPHFINVIVLASDISCHFFSFILKLFLLHHFFPSYVSFNAVLV